MMNEDLHDLLNGSNDLGITQFLVRILFTMLVQDVDTVNPRFIKSSLRILSLPSIQRFKTWLANISLRSLCRVIRILTYSKRAGNVLLIKQPGSW